MLLTAIASQLLLLIYLKLTPALNLDFYNDRRTAVSVELLSVCLTWNHAYWDSWGVQKANYKTGSSSAKG